MSEPFIGEIKMIAFNYAPRNWAFCDGSLFPISQNPTLFALINSYYGGDGTQTCALPDLRGRVPVQAGRGPGLTYRQFGEVGGAESVPLTERQLPVHSHDLSGTNENATDTEPNGRLCANGVAGGGGSSGTVNAGIPVSGVIKIPDGSKGGGTTTYNLEDGKTSATGAITGGSAAGVTATYGSGDTVEMSGASIGNTGEGKPHYNMMPYLALNFIIALDGIFPPRN